MNLHMSLDAPLWRAFVVLNYLKSNKTLILIKIHHAIGDGSSVLFMNMCLSGPYDKNQLIQYRLGIYQRLLAYMFIPLFIPHMALKAMTVFRD